MRELITYFIHRIRRDEIMLEAASLSFTTVLALVPALTVIVSIFTLAPAFEPLKESLKDFVTANFMPVFSEAIAEHMGQFVSKAGSMTVTGSLVLIAVSLLLVRSVDKSINRIWKGGRRRRTMTFAIYWTLLTVGPLSVALTLWLSSRLVTMAIFELDISLAQQVLYVITPVLIEMAVVTTLFITVPVALVRFTDALLGALFVTVLFEISKKIFSVFIINFSDYEAIYGALAAIPVLMIWININWWIILLGAEFTSCLGLVRGGNVDDVPRLMALLAGLTGSNLGSSEVINHRRPPTVRVRISKRAVRR